MNILVLEDRGSVSFYLEETLRNQGHQVFSASSILDAQHYWDEGNIDCIIADSNMSPNGLREGEVEATLGGLLAGWVWLQNHVFSARKDMKERTVVYTDFSDHIKRSIPNGDLGGVHVISKKGSTNPAVELLKYVERVARIVESQS